MMTKKLEMTTGDGVMHKPGVFKAAGRKIGKALAGAALAAGLMLGTPKAAKADSIELMAGDKSATVDVKVSVPLPRKLGLFFRARPSVDYTGDIHAFGLADLSIGLCKGLDAVGELQVIGGKVVPRAGVQYFIKKGDFSAYALATVGLDAAPYIETLLALKYAPELRRYLRLLAAVESITDISRAGHGFSTQRIRLGIEYMGWGVGAAADLTETGNHPRYRRGTFGYNVGGFISKTF
ncbi:MAG: hypothetical protein V1827_03875 [Candidatus Micrarchaeota archaeon]